MQISKRDDIQLEAFNQASRFRRRTLAISMRVGKTLIGIKLIHKKIKENVDSKILIVAPKLSIFDSWKEDIDKFNYDFLHKNIEYATYASLNKLELSKYDLIILDEVHSLTPNQSNSTLFNTNTRLDKYTGEILGLTGTPPKSKSSIKYRLLSKFCPIVYRYDTEEAITNKILNDYRIIVHLIPLSDKKDVHIKRGKWDFWTSERKSYESLTKKIEQLQDSTKGKQWANLSRMKALQTFKSKEVYAKKLFDQIEEKCLLFTNTKEQAKSMCSHYYFSGNDSNKVNLEMFKFDLIDKLACVLQLSEGQTIPGLKSSIIMHSYGNENKFSQRFARCLSLSQEEISTIHVLCYENTVDEIWVKNSMDKLDQSKIQYKKFNL